MTEQSTPELIQQLYGDMPDQPTERFYEMMSAAPWTQAEVTHVAPRNGNRSLLWLTLAAGLCLFALGGLFVGLNLREQVYADDAARQRLNTVLDTTIPADAITIHFTENYVFEWTAHARFDAAPDAAQAWIESLETCYEDSSRPTYLVDQIFNETWWQRDQATASTRYTCAESRLADGRRFQYSLYLDESSDERWIVYLTFLEIRR